jgi:hypothetical protein
MTAFSCASKPAAEPIAAPITTQEEADVAYRQVYEQFREDLILEGAGKYTVKRGDTLSKIARAQYNNGFYYPIIMLASSEVVLDPDKIEPGMELTIPVIQTNLDDTRAKGKIKNFFGEIAKIEERRNRAANAQNFRDMSVNL